SSRSVCSPWSHCRLWGALTELRRRAFGNRRAECREATAHHRVEARLHHDVVEQCGAERSRGAFVELVAQVAIDQDRGDDLAAQRLLLVHRGGRDALIDRVDLGLGQTGCKSQLRVDGPLELVHQCASRLEDRDLAQSWWKVTGDGGAELDDRLA